MFIASPSLPVELQRPGPFGQCFLLQPTVREYVGKLGALSSDFLFQILGLAALYLPVLLMVVGYKTLRNRPPGISIHQALCLLLHRCHTQRRTHPAFSQPAGDGQLHRRRHSGYLFAHLLLLFLNTPGSLLVVATPLDPLSDGDHPRLSIDQTLSWIQNLNWKALWAMPNHYADWRKRRQHRKKLAQLSQDKRKLWSSLLPKRCSCINHRQPLPQRGKGLPPGSCFPPQPIHLQEQSRNQRIASILPLGLR